MIPRGSDRACITKLKVDDFIKLIGIDAITAVIEKLAFGEIQFLASLRWTFNISCKLTNPRLAPSVDDNAPLPALLFAVVIPKEKVVGINGWHQVRGVHATVFLKAFDHFFGIPLVFPIIGIY